MQKINDNTIAFAFDNTYKKLPNKLFTFVAPTPVKSPTVVQFNDTLATELGLSPQGFSMPHGAEILSGNALPPGAASIAQAYAGHQFGHFTRLGDGRAILIGEHITPSGERFDIQLKGAGPTPYSRSGDGRAALGPMLREYLISEAMHALGVPSTRSLAVVTTGETVRRESDLHGAVLTRIAKSHLRVGTFQYAAAALPLEDFKTLANYAITRHFPHCHDSDNPYITFLESVISAQASLIAKWQSLGFVHGVMNTDNMAISGETIDFGPCAFLDTYVPNAVFSSIDQGGRYAYNNQPHIAGWNLARFAEALLPLIAESIDDSKDSDSQALEFANKALQRFIPEFEMHDNLVFCQKIGIQKVQPNALNLVSELLDLMYTHQLDFTYTFYALTRYLDQPDNHHLTPLAHWMVKWQAHLSNQQKETQSEASFPYDLMKSVNPAVIPYNHHVEDALKEAVINGNYEPFKNLLSLLKEPYAYSNQQCQAAAPAPRNPSEKPYRTFCGT
jgi:uncharacterized protein YdiU (UPF0061 family)